MDIGITYPWIKPPVAIYSESFGGPQATREAYTGVSLLWDGNHGDWTYGTDLFAGQVNLTGMTITGLAGLTGRAGWNDVITLQATYYSGEMKTDPAGALAILNNNTHDAVLFGAKADWHNLVAYYEWADVEMDVTGRPGDSESWYATLGYRFGAWLPHVTVQNWERSNLNGHDITTIGVAYTLAPSIVIKAETGKIKTDNVATGESGLFDSTPGDDSTRLSSVAVDLVF